MWLFLHIFFIVCIGLFAYLVYGAWFKDFGGKMYDMLKNVSIEPFFFFLTWKSRPNSVRYYKALVLFYLLLFTVVYIFLIIGGLVIP